MRLSTRARYGVQAMMDIALFGAGGPVSLKEISERQDISGDYLEQLLRRLRRGGLVRSVRGPHGGFLLSKPADKIHLWDIVVALEQEIAPVYCVEEELLARPAKGQCPKAGGCATHVLWLGLAREMRSYLEARTLRDMLPSGDLVCAASVAGEAITFQI